MSLTGAGRRVALAAAACALLLALAASAGAPGLVASAAATGAPVWQPAPLPTGFRGATSELVGVSCPSQTDCTAVGQRIQAGAGASVPLIESWDGRRWSLVADPGFVSRAGLLEPGPALAGVSCPTAGWCVAVGSNESSSEMAPLIEVGHGGRWRPVANRVVADGPAGGLDAVSCVTPSMCVAVGGAQLGGGIIPLIERWDGHTWSRIPPASGPSSGDVALMGVDCTTERSCTAVGARTSFDPVGEATVIEDWNGTTWSLVPGPNPGPDGSGLAAVSCRTEVSCTAVGSEGGLTASSRPLIEISTGSHWTVDPIHLGGPDRSAQLDGVSCGSPPFCFAVGSIQRNTFGSSTAPLVVQTSGPFVNGPFVNVVGGYAADQVAVTGPPGSGALLHAVACDPSFICTATGTTLGSDTAALVISDDAPIGPGRSLFPMVLVPVVAVVVVAVGALLLVRRRRTGPGSLQEDPGVEESRPEGTHDETRDGAAEGHDGAAAEGPDGEAAGAFPIPVAEPEDPTVWARSDGDETTEAPPPAEPPLWADDPDDSSQWAPPDR